MRRHTGSVLPKVAVTRLPDGFRIFAERENTKDDVGQFLVLVFGFPLIVAIAILNNVEPLNFLIQSAPLAVVLYFVGRRLHAYRKRRGLFGDSHLDFSSWPIRLGEEVLLKFRKHTKSPMEVTLIAAHIECVERVTSGHGRYQSTKGEPRWHRDLHDSDWSHSDASGSWKIRMPAREPASVEIHRMKVEWIVTVITSGRGVEKRSEFRLIVIPEVAE